MVDKRADLKSDWKSSGSLYEGESRDIHDEVRRVLGDEYWAEWLRVPNVRFGGKAPEEIIKAGEEFWVRDVLRSYLYVGSS
jgi:hypothetical protein